MSEDIGPISLGDAEQQQWFAAAEVSQKTAETVDSEVTGCWRRHTSRALEILKESASC